MDPKECPATLDHDKPPGLYCTKIILQITLPPIKYCETCSLVLKIYINVLGA